LALDANPMMGAITAWHGSPHIFNKFDNAKIGTGEGAQAYGHGLYFAEAPAVAKEYQKNLSGYEVGTKGILDRSQGNIDDAILNATNKINHYKNMIAEGGYGGLDRAENLLNLSSKQLQNLQDMKAGIPENKGALYKVDIADESIPNMLDWDKPLYQQAMYKTLKDKIPYEQMPHGSKSVKELFDSLGGQVNASKILQEHGITGVKYLDEASRSIPYKVELYHKNKLYADNDFANKYQAEEYMKQKQLEGFTPKLKEQGTRNFVVFNPNTVKILERK
jgi:hypothetical protein